MTDHGAQPGPKASSERIEHDRGAWISGPCLDSPEANTLAAEHARAYAAGGRSSGLARLASW
jgi:hypothetical protein